MNVEWYLVAPSIHVRNKGGLSWWLDMSRRRSIASFASSFVAVALALSVVSGASAARPPNWLKEMARTSARSLSDGTRPVTIEYIEPRSRFPRVVLTGSFSCKSCSSISSKVPRGSVATMRYDGETHELRDFALCGERGRCLASLCNGAPCTHRNLLFDAAVTALVKRGSNAESGYRRGTFRCHVEFSRDDSRYSLGSCTLTLRLVGGHSAVLRFTKRWSREFLNGRWLDVPLRTHTWRVLVTHDGWRTRVTSTGDPVPRS